MNATKRNTGRLIATAVLLSLLLIAIGGCSNGKYGRLTSNKETTGIFESYQILPGHKYYYWGTQSKPIILVGINQSYELNSTMWVEIDPNSKDFRRVVEIISLQGHSNTISAWGFIILDQADANVGVWYSAIRAAAVKTNENNQIVQLAPMGTAAIGDQRQ